MTAPRSPLLDISAFEKESSQGSRSNLTLSDSITRRVDDLSINDSPLHRVRITHGPPINIYDIISRVDCVGCSITECIELVETALHRPRDSADRIPLGLHNNSAIYLDPIRVSMENLHISILVQPSVNQVGSDLVPGPDAGYQEALFTLPPNHDNSTDRRQISVVSTDEASVVGEDEETRHHRHHRTDLHVERCKNKATISQAEVDLRTAKGRRPRVAAPRPTPPTLWNFDDDFILECDDQAVFATSSANLAVTFEVLDTLPRSST
jgi:hypothetical protein